MQSNYCRVDSVQSRYISLKTNQKLKRTTDLYQMIPATEQTNPPHLKTDTGGDVVAVAAYNSHNNRVVAVGVVVVGGGDNDATGLELSALQVGNPLTTCDSLQQLLILNVENQTLHDLEPLHDH
jgi:hypothetical protein